MNPETKALLKRGILDCLPILEAHVGKYREPWWIWKKENETRWQGKLIMSPAIGHLFTEQREVIETSGTAFIRSLLSAHPEYNGLVGYQNSGLFNYSQDRTFLFRHVLGYLWQKCESFAPEEQAIDIVISEVEEFVDNTETRFLIRAQLKNFRAEVDRIELPEGLSVRRLAESEISEIYGGSAAMPIARPSWDCGIHEFCIETEVKVPKMFGRFESQEQPPVLKPEALFDKAILALRTFKGGRVGYEEIRYIPVGFCPVPMALHGRADARVPMGTYNVGKHEIEPLVEHTALVFGIDEDAMSLACSRLSDAEQRSLPRDCILDAVIGMEALLLASKESRTGELSFRFSLNFAMLAASDKRESAFRLAKDLYTLRSQIAHGGQIDESRLRISGEKVSWTRAANLATEALRRIIKYFLANKGSLYRDDAFWRQAYFGLSDQGS